jgi:ketosteroid isomerase-like protein
MRTRTIFAIVFVILACCLVSQAHNRNSQEVRRLERAWLDAYEKHDVKAMNEIVADDFVITFPDGSMQTKSQIMELIKVPRQTGRPTLKFQTDDVQARGYGNTVILMGRVVTEWQRDEQTQSKEQQRYTGDKGWGERILSAVSVRINRVVLDIYSSVA